MFIFRKKGQSTAEYAVLIAVVVAVAIAMQTYVNRGIKAGVKFAVDKVKKGDVDNPTGQYEPYYLESAYDTSTKAYKDTEETKKGGRVIRTYGVDGDKITIRKGEQITRPIPEPKTD